MTKRRAHGDGSIYYEATRARWVGTLDLGPDPATGKRRRAKVTGDSRAEVARRLRERRQTIEAGDMAPAKMKLADLLDQFQAAVVPTMTPNTAADVVDHLKAARAGLGAIRLGTLRAHHVETWLGARADGGLSRSTVRRDRFTLARVIRWGQRRDLVSRNAAELAELPATPAPTEGRALAADELRRLLKAAEDTRYAALWWVMAGVGLRPAEALGLSWADVDLDGGILHIRQAMKRENRGHVLGDLKTSKSRRSLAMPAPVVDAIRAHRKRQAAERLLVGSTWPAEWRGLVFVTDNGIPPDPANLRRYLITIAKAAKVGHVRQYDLRHTCATLMAANGSRIEDVADQLGHAGLHLARTIYVHTTAPTVSHAVGPMGAALAGGPDEAHEPKALAADG